MSVYTKTGDSGETSLLGGRRCCKDCIEMEVIGELDELNANIGLIVSLENNLKEKLIKIQNDLFVIGSNVAGVQTDLKNIPKLKSEDVEYLEIWIDEMDNELPELKQFILPGGNQVAVQCFLARAVCRRVERQLVALKRKFELDDTISEYLNRLSDLLFVLGRFLNKDEGDEFWGK